jgi:hypothetical protein
MRFHASLPLSASSDVHGERVIVIDQTVAAVVVAAVAVCHEMSWTT